MSEKWGGAPEPKGPGILNPVQLTRPCARAFDLFLIQAYPIRLSVQSYGERGWRVCGKVSGSLQRTKHRCPPQPNRCALDPWRRAPNGDFNI